MQKSSSKEKFLDVSGLIHKNRKKIRFSVVVFAPFSFLDGGTARNDFSSLRYKRNQGQNIGKATVRFELVMNANC